MSEHFKKQAAADLTGLTPRKIQFYTENLEIRPDIYNPENKKGSDRKYSRENLIEFLLAKELSEMGLNLKIIKKIMQHISECKKRGQTWFKDRVQGKQSKEVVYCFLYDSFDSEKMDIKYQHTVLGAGHLYDVDGSPWTIQKYTRQSEGVRKTEIFDLTASLDRVMRSVNF